MRLKRKPFKRVKKRRKTQKDLWAEYGLEKPPYVRYSGLAGILWCVMSRHIRKTEFEQYDGACVDGCGRKVLDWREADCGHFMSASKLSTRFLRENLGLQTKFCNSPFMGNDNTYGYGKTINERYGAGTAERIIELSRKTSEPLTKAWYDAEIRKYLKLSTSQDLRVQQESDIVQEGSLKEE